MCWKIDKENTTGVICNYYNCFFYLNRFGYTICMRCDDLVTVILMYNISNKFNLI